MFAHWNLLQFGNYDFRLYCSLRSLDFISAFPDYNQAYLPGKLKAFLADLYSGKLHREFHYGPDPETTEEPQQV